MCRPTLYPSDARPLCERKEESNDTATTQLIDGRSVMGIVWAIPVRPDRLGYALSVFAARMKDVHPPLVRFLKFAQKAGNPCAKLPPELVRLVTDLVLDSEHDFPTPAEQMWPQGYLCSQVKCSSCQHVTDDVIEDFADDFDRKFGSDKFDLGDPFPWVQCPEWDNDYNEYGGRDEYEKRLAEENESCSSMASDRDPETGNTPAQQRFLDERACSIHLTERGGGTRVNDHDYKEQITEWILDRRRWSHDKRHNAVLQKWLKLFDQRPGGHFARLDKVLKKFFGLEAFISIQPGTSCQAYLHLPVELASLDVEAPELPTSKTVVHARGAQITTPAMLQDIGDTDRARFTNALRDLNLDIDIHPMSSSSNVPSHQKGGGPDDTKAAKHLRAEKMEWPMRIQVMKMVYEGKKTRDCECESAFESETECECESESETEEAWRPALILKGPLTPFSHRV